MKLLKFSTVLIAIFCICACQPKVTKKDALQTKVNSQIDSIQGDIAVAFLNLSDPTDSLFINADESFHAASTMKVPVMIELFKQQNECKINLNDSILLLNEFKSIDISDNPL